MLHHAFIETHNDYNLIIWVSPTKSSLKIIFSLAISIKKENHSTESLFQEQLFLNFENQKNLQSACFTWKLSNNETPAFISEHLQTNNK